MWVPLGEADSVSEGTARGFDPTGCGRDTLFLVRTAGVLRGWLDQCPHEGLTPLPYRRHRYLDRRGERIVCFAHGARFDPISGICVQGPCKGEGLKAVPLRRKPDGQWWAQLPEQPQGQFSKQAGSIS